MDDKKIERIETGGNPIEFLTNGEDLSGCTLVTGFYGIGKIGFIAVNHMIQKLNAKRIGFVVTEYLPPFLSVRNQDLILPFELYKSDNIVFLAAFFEPQKYEHRAFAKAIIQWAKSKRMNNAILIGGLDSRLRTEEEVLAKAVYTTLYREMFPAANVPSLDEGLYVTGPLALLLMYCELYDFPGIAILPYAERSRPDPIGASHAVEIINDLLGTNCGVEELIKEAENIEREIQSMMDATESMGNDNGDNQGADKGMFL